MARADELIRTLELEPHVEGGYFRELLRSEETVPGTLPDRYSGSRCYYTNIYFMLRSSDISHLHRLTSDEIWHFLEGSPTCVVIINPDGALQTVRLGADTAAGEVFTVLMPRGSWFGAFLPTPAALSEDAYSLISCTVSPGFEYDDFELASRDALLAQYPAHKEIICKLT